MKKVLTVGGAMYDIFTQYDDVETLELCSDGNIASYLIMRAGRKIEVNNLIYHCGGGATNSAVSFEQAGFFVESFFKIGIDYAGDFILKSLKCHNVSTDHVSRSESMPTGTSFVVPGPKGNRSVLVYRGANVTLVEADVPSTLLDGVHQLYVTSLTAQASHVLLPLVMNAKRKQISVAVNPGTSQLKGGADLFLQSLPYIDVLILNSYEAQLLMSSLFPEKLYFTNYQTTKELPELLQKPVGNSAFCFSLPHFFEIIHEKGPSVVVVTNGSEGVYASDQQCFFFHPSIKTNIVSSIGAGDAFGSTFVASLLHNRSIEDSLRAGIINSASVITQLGTQTGLLKYEEVNARLSVLDKSLLQKYPLIK